MRTLLNLFRLMSIRRMLDRRVRLALTVLGIASGVALYTSISIINATVATTARANIRNLAGAAELEVAAPGESGLLARTVRDVAATPGVRHAVPLLRVSTRLTGEARATAVVLGVTPSVVELFPRSPDAFGEVTVEGGFTQKGLVLSTVLAEELGVDVGDRVEVDAGRGRQSLGVSGIVSGGPTSLVNDGRVGVMTLESAQATFGREGHVDSVYVVVEPTESLSDVTARLEDRLGDGAIVGPPGERGRGIQQTIDSLATLTSLGGIVALFVAAFVVYNTMSMAVAERRREISMALALGVMRRQVFVSLIGEAAVVGMAASLAGVFGGWALAKLLIGQTVEQYGAVGVQAGTRLAVNQAHLLAGFVGGVVVTVAGSTLPARSVRSVAPIEFLRPQAPYEPAQPRGAHSARIPVSLAACAGVAGLGVLVAGAVTNTPLATSIGLLVGLGGVTSLLPRVIPTGMRLLRAPLRRLAGLLGRIAADSLGNNPGRTSLTVGALALTLAMVIGVGSAIGSYQKRFNDGASRWFRASLYVMPESYNVFGADQPFPLRLRDAIEAVPAVAAAYPESYTALDLEGEQLILYRASIVESFRDGRRDLWTPALTDQGVTGIEEKVRRLAGGGVLLSSLAARERDLDIGDSFALPTPDGTRRLPVAGTFDDMNSLQSVYIDYYEYGEIWDDWTVDRFSVLLAPGEDRHDAALAISSALDDRGLDARVATPEELVGFLADATDDVFAVARLVQVAALIIAGFAIANTMFISVYQRRWELGLQRVLGMSTRQTTLSIVLESGAIGVLGSGAAVALGTGLGALMLKVMTLQYAWQVPFRPDVVLPLSAVLVGVGIASVAGLYPARLAARPAPIDVLRFE